MAKLYSSTIIDRVNLKREIFKWNTISLQDLLCQLIAPKILSYIHTSISLNIQFLSSSFLTDTSTLMIYDDKR